MYFIAERQANLTIKEREIYHENNSLKEMNDIKVNILKAFSKKLKALKVLLILTKV